MKNEKSVLSARRMPHVDLHVFRKVRSSSQADVIKTHARSCVILPEMIGRKIEVYNGKKYIPVEIQEEMVGRKLGEFSPTRTFKAHGGDKNIDRAKAKGGKK